MLRSLKALILLALTNKSTRGFVSSSRLLPFGIEATRRIEVNGGAEDQSTCISVEGELEEFWISVGVTNRSYLSKLLAIKSSVRRNPVFLRERLTAIAVATRVNSIEASARLVARAPGLLSYDPATLSAKVDTLTSYLVGVDVVKMIQRQPTLLQRDVDVQVARKLAEMALYFPDDLATMVERQPALLFVDVGGFKEKVARLHRIMAADFNGTTESDVNALLAKAPALLSYSIDTIEQTLEDWKLLLPGLSLSRAWTRNPSLLHCDVETNIGPKIRILQHICDLGSSRRSCGAAAAGENDRLLADFLCTNPMLLSYSREKYTRLLYQSERLSGFLDASDIRKTLMTDKSLELWMRRLSMDDSGEDYAIWLQKRLAVIEDEAVVKHANGVAFKNTESRDNTVDLSARRTRTRPSKSRRPRSSSSNFARLSALEKSNGVAFAKIEGALVRNIEEVLGIDELQGGFEADSPSK